VEQFEEENEGIAIPTQLRWLGNTHTIREPRHNGEFAASSVVFVVKGSRLTQSLINRGIKAAGVWYRVEATATTLVSVRNTRVFRTPLTALTEPRTL
jgi:hypothetical protein